MFYIYTITCIENGKIYVGSTKSRFKTRVCQHRTRLDNRTHPNDALLRDWVKYGEKAFVFEIVKQVDDEKADKLKMEQRYMDQYDWDQLYNEQKAHSGIRPKRHNNRYAGIRCVETGIVYPSVPEAAKILKLNASHIHQCAKGQRHTCGTYHWSYIYFDKEVKE
jgi:hypothetical protein